MTSDVLLASMFNFFPAHLEGLKYVEVLQAHELEDVDPDIRPGSQKTENLCTKMTDSLAYSNSNSNQCHAISLIM